MSMSAPQTEAEKLAELIRGARTPWVTNSEHKAMELAQAEAILAAGYGSIAEAAHEARRETLVAVQAHVRATIGAGMPYKDAIPEVLQVLVLLDGSLSDTLVEHAKQDPRGRALAEGILERKAAKG